MNNNTNGTRFDRFKRLLAIASGIAVLGCSIYLSKRGVGFDGDLWWMGLIVAIALCCSQFIFNGRFSELTWTGIVLGFGAYIYSINTNIDGFYYYRHIPGTLWTNFDLTSFLGGAFMDIYPEWAIAWGLKESKVGDFLGNLVKTFSDPDQLTTEGKADTVSQRSLHEVVNQKPKPRFNQNFNPNQTLHQLVNTADGRHNKNG